MTLLRRLLPSLLVLAVLAASPGCDPSNPEDGEELVGPEPADAGATGGGTPDGGTARDAGTRTDGGAPRDGGTRTDAGLPRDAGTPADAGTGGTWNEGMLTEHNRVRASATPTPQPALPALTWSTSAAAVAQDWANRCTWEHNAGRGKLGENLYASSSATVTPAQVVGSWASEAADYDLATNSCSGVCGHYTQVVWRSTLQVGCASQRCTTPPPWGGAGAWTLVVCNYSPPGNYVGQRPY